MVATSRSHSTGEVDILEQQQELPEHKNYESRPCGCANVVPEPDSKGEAESGRRRLGKESSPGSLSYSVNDAQQTTWLFCLSILSCHMATARGPWDHWEIKRGNKIKYSKKCPNSRSGLKKCYWLLLDLVCHENDLPMAQLWSPLIWTPSAASHWMHMNGFYGCSPTVATSALTTLSSESPKLAPYSRITASFCLAWPSLFCLPFGFRLATSLGRSKRLPSELLNSCCRWSR